MYSNVAQHTLCQVGRVCRALEISIVPLVVGVWNAAGRPAPGVAISLSDGGVEVASGVTDGDGWWAATPQPGLVGDVAYDVALEGLVAGSAVVGYGDPVAGLAGRVGVEWAEGEPSSAVLRVAPP